MFISFFFGKGTNVIVTCLFLFNVIASEFVFEKEALTKENPCTDEPHRAKYYKRTKLISALSIGFVDEFFKRSELSIVFGRRFTFLPFGKGSP